MGFCMGNFFSFWKRRKSDKNKRNYDDYNDDYYDEYKRLLDEKNNKLINNMKIYRNGDYKYEPKKYNNVFYDVWEQKSIINDLKDGCNSNVLFTNSNIMKRRRYDKNIKKSTVENPTFNLEKEIKQMEDAEKWKGYREKIINNKIWQESNDFFKYDPISIQYFIYYYKKRKYKEKRERASMMYI